MDKAITADAAPAMGDVRTMGIGDTLWLEGGVWNRRDWGRYVFVIAEAVSRGADVRWVRK